MIIYTHPQAINHVPHHLLLSGVETARGEILLYPRQFVPTGLFFKAAAHAARVFGASALALKSTTSFYWLFALALIFLCGKFIKDAEAGLWAALVFCSMTFANTLSRGFDIHVPRMAWELAVLASVIAFMRFGKWRYLVIAALSLVAGFYYRAIPSDGPLFLIGVSGAIASAPLFAWWSQRKTHPKVFYLIAAATPVALLFACRWIWAGGAIGIHHYLEEAFRYQSGPGGVAGVFIHALAYPAYLCLTAIGLPVLILALVAVPAAIRDRNSSFGYWLPVLCAPLVILTLIPKKNAYYACVVLPFLALGIGVGVRLIVKKRPKFAIPALALILIANLAAWFGVRQDLPLGPFAEAFQLAGPYHYRATQPNDLAIKRMQRLEEMTDKACAPEGSCLIGLLGVIPDELEIFAPTAVSRPGAKLVKMLQFDIPQSQWDFDILVINTASFSPNYSEVFDGKIDMNDLRGVAWHIDRQIGLLNRRDNYRESALNVLGERTSKYRYAGRFEYLDYYFALNRRMSSNIETAEPS